MCKKGILYICDKSLEFHLQFWTIKVILFLNFAFYGNNFWDVITGWYIYRTVPVLSENLATFESSYLDNCKHNCFAFCLTRSYLFVDILKQRNKSILYIPMPFTKLGKQHVVTIIQPTPNLIFMI